jgi:hypothetical protein
MVIAKSSHLTMLKNPSMLFHKSSEIFTQLSTNVSINKIEKSSNNQNGVRIVDNRPRFVGDARRHLNSKVVKELARDKAVAERALRLVPRHFLSSVNGARARAANQMLGSTIRSRGETRSLQTGHSARTTIF